MKQAKVLVCLSFFLLYEGCATQKKPAGKSPIEGVYKQECMPEDGHGDKSMNSEFIFKGDSTFMITSRKYQNANCSSLNREDKMSGSYSSGANLDAPAGAKELDITLQKRIVTIFNQEALDIYNREGVCGQWEKGVPKDISSCHDYGFLTGNETHYGSFFLTDTGIELPDSKNGDVGKTPATRLTDFTHSAKLIRQ